MGASLTLASLLAIQVVRDANRLIPGSLFGGKRAVSQDANQVFEHVARAEEVGPDFEKGESVFESGWIARPKLVTSRPWATGESEFFVPRVKLSTGCRPEGQFSRSAITQLRCGVHLLMQQDNRRSVVLDARMDCHGNGTIPLRRYERHSFAHFLWLRCRRVCARHLDRERPTAVTYHPP